MTRERRLERLEAASAPPDTFPTTEEADATVAALAAILEGPDSDAKRLLQAEVAALDDAP